MAVRRSANAPRPLCCLYSSPAATMLFKCWPIVFDASPTLKQHWATPRVCLEAKGFSCMADVKLAETPEKEPGLCVITWPGQVSTEAGNYQQTVQQWIWLVDRTISTNDSARIVRRCWATLIWWHSKHLGALAIHGTSMTFTHQRKCLLLFLIKVYDCSEKHNTLPTRNDDPPLFNVGPAS